MSLQMRCLALVAPVVKTYTLEQDILLIDAGQTPDERAHGETVYDNKRGWNGRDASFGSSLARQIRNGWTLTTKQRVAATRMMKKYAGQCTRVRAAQKAA